MEIIEKVETVFSKIKKIFHWVPFLWRLDDGSYESLYEVNIKQMTDMKNEFEKFSDVFPKGNDYFMQMEEVKLNLFLAMHEPNIEVAKRYVQRAFEIMAQESLEWWI